jgi:hypothetical protein
MPTTPISISGGAGSRSRTNAELEELPEVVLLDRGQLRHQQQPGTEPPDQGIVPRGRYPIRMILLALKWVLTNPSELQLTPRLAVISHQTSSLFFIPLITPRHGPP